MHRVRIAPAPDREALDIEIARLRDLDIGGLHSRWHSVWGRPAPLHLPRHLLFRILAYRLQADHWGDLDADSKRLLDRSEVSRAGWSKCCCTEPAKHRASPRHRSEPRMEWADASRGGS